MARTNFALMSIEDGRWISGEEKAWFCEAQQLVRTDLYKIG